MFYRKKLTNLIIKYGRLCGEKNYTPGYSGNISARYREGMLITTSGSSNGYLDKKDIVYTNFDGKSLETGKKPSSEKFLHIGIYNLRPDINFILHVHSPYLSSFASSGRDLMEPIMAVMKRPYLRILQNGTKVWEHLWETPRFCCFRPVQTAVDGKHMMSWIRYIRY